MSTVHDEKVRLPAWIREAIRNSKPPVELSARRREPRGTWSGLYVVQPAKGPEVERTYVRATDISSGGVQCISLWDLPLNAVVDLIPANTEGDPVRVRVVHCTETRKGYMIGFAFVGEGA